jgi:hypothetical protein
MNFRTLTAAAGLPQRGIAAAVRTTKSESRLQQRGVARAIRAAQSEPGCQQRGVATTDSHRRMMNQLLPATPSAVYRPQAWLQKCKAYA